MRAFRTMAALSLVATACTAGPGPAPRQPAPRAPVLRQSPAPLAHKDFPPPSGAAGFVFGSNPAEAAESCKAAGNEVRQLGKSVVCRGGAAPLAPAKVASASFCPSGELCLIVLVMPDVKEGRLTVKQLTARLSEQLGEPTSQRINIPSQCEQTLAACLENGEAAARSNWSWKSGFSVSLQLWPHRDGAVGMTVTYATLNGQRRQSEGL